MNILNKHLIVEMPDSSKWSVPVRVIAEHRAKYYESEFASFEESLNEDTVLIFTDDHDAIEDWASNNMNWYDFEDCAVKVQDSKVDYQDGWVNGSKHITSNKPKMVGCMWAMNDDALFVTQCKKQYVKEAFSINDGFRYCPYCGKEINEVTMEEFLQ